MEELLLVNSLMQVRHAVICSAAAMMISAPPARATELRFGIDNPDLGKLDPHATVVSGDRYIIQSVFSGLVRFKPGSGDVRQIEPDLAEKWESSSDGRVWIFHLRPGVKWHRGYGEVNADDVIFSLNRAANKDTSSFASDYTAFDKVEAVDPLTVRITLKEAVPSLLGLVVNSLGGNIVSKKAVEELGAAYAQKPIGTGPFMFEEYKPQHAVTLTANPDYFRGKPKIDRVIFRYIQSQGSRDLALQSGELDITGGALGQDWIERTRKLRGIKVDTLGLPEIWWLHLNKNSKPLDDLRVREAIAYAVNRPALISFRGEASHRAARSVIPASHAGFTADVTLPEHNLDKAKALLTEAGYSGGLTLKVINTNRPSLREVIEVIQSQLRKVGINLDIELVDHSTYHARIRKDQSQIVLYGANRFPVADSTLTQFFYSKSIVGTPTAVTNFSHCDVADAQIEAARAELAPNKQDEFWKVAQQKIVKHLCAVPLMEVLYTWAHRDKVDYGYELKDTPSGGPLITETTSIAP
jgi:peptide/nickel transport system substrate-binding protein